MRNRQSGSFLRLSNLFFYGKMPPFFVFIEILIGIRQRGQRSATSYRALGLLERIGIFVFGSKTSILSVLYVDFCVFCYLKKFKAERIGKKLKKKIQ